MTPVELAQGQLDAYNARDIDRFCQYYASDIRIYDGRTGKLRMEGMEAFRTRYTAVFTKEDLHCTLVNRMVQGNIVIDQEEVIVDKEAPLVHAIAVYRVEKEKIQEVRFY